MVVDFILNRAPHEFRDGCGLVGFQMHLENPAIRQNGVEMLDKPAVITADAAQILTPGLQAEGEQVNQQGTLNLCVSQILSVFPHISRVGPFAWPNPRQAAQAPVVTIEGLLSDRVGRSRRSGAGPRHLHVPILARLAGPRQLDRRSGNSAQVESHRTSGNCSRPRSFVSDRNCVFGTLLQLNCGTLPGVSFKR